MRFRDILYTLAVLICGTAVSSAQFLINPYAFTAAGGGGGGGTHWITNASPLNATSSSYSGYIGGWFTVGGSNITVTHLARWVNAGNSQTHLLKIWDTSGTELASASLDASLFSAERGSVALGASLVLTASTQYIIGTQEFSGGDTWHEYNSSTYTVTGVATLDGYGYGATYPNAYVADAGKIYGPVSFIYGL